MKHRRTDAEEAHEVEQRLEQHGPEDPTDLSARSWSYVLRRTVREFGKDECTDLAAALTYYAVLSLFPAAIALLSLVGVLGQGPSTARTLLGILRRVGAGSTADTLQPTLSSIANRPQAAGVALVVGILAAVWSASGYVGAFGRAMNRMYEVREGRPIWKLRPVQLVVTVLALLLAAAVALALVVTGQAADAVGRALGIGSTAVTVWNIAKWPVIVVVVVLVVAMLYYATPNVRQPRFRWISLGAGLAIVIWVVASALFGFYVATFASYDKNYGALAGVVVFLLWLWITNLALLLGAELDAELERGRELQAGLPAERSLQLPPRDTRKVEKSEEKERRDIEQAQALRESADASRDH